MNFILNIQWDKAHLGLDPKRINNLQINNLKISRNIKLQHKILKIKEDPRNLIDNNLHNHHNKFHKTHKSNISSNSLIILNNNSYIERILHYLTKVMMINVPTMTLMDFNRLKIM